MCCIVQHSTLNSPTEGSLNLLQVSAYWNLCDVGLCALIPTKVRSEQAREEGEENGKPPSENHDEPQIMVNLERL